MEITSKLKPVRFTLPNGVVIEASLSGDRADGRPGECKGIEISAICPDGTVKLCAVEWVDELGVRAIINEIADRSSILVRHFGKMDGTDSPILLKMSARELAVKIRFLPNGDTVRFYTDKDGNGDFDVYGITSVDAFGASHILINAYGGRSPYVVDMTVSQDRAKLLEEALNRYFEQYGIEAPIYFVVEDTEKGLI